MNDDGQSEPGYSVTMNGHTLAVCWSGTQALERARLAEREAAVPGDELAIWHVSSCLEAHIIGQGPGTGTFLR